MTAPFVRLDGQRQVVRGAARAAAPLWASWGHHEVADVHSWPCLSPDGGTWAALRVARTGGEARIVVSAREGEERESLPLGGIPIYLRWSPGGARLAAIVQRGDDLALLVLEAGGDAVETWATGSPLYVDWLDDERLVAHVGRAAGGTEVVVVDRSGLRPFPGQPGSFCAPIATPAGVVWVGVAAGHGRLVVTAPAGLPTRELERVDGLVALVPAPGGRVLRAVSAEGDGDAYHELRVVDPRTGRATRCADDALVAFAPAGPDRVLLVRKDARHARFTFSVASTDGRDEQRIVDVEPSRDLRFWARFFEQFASSHPLVDPAGTTLLVAGQRAAGQTARVWRAPLDGGPIEDLGEGPFACWVPAREGRW